MTVNTDGGSSTITAHWKMFLGGTQVLDQHTLCDIGSYGEFDIPIRYVINIGEKNDIANAHILNWDTPLEMRIDGAAYDTSNDEATWHKQYWHVNTRVRDDESKYQHPTLKIQAIGRKSDTTFLNSFFNERKGQVLETLSGVCDGRSVTVDSGTYTLPNVTQGTDIVDESTANFIDFPGSSITYKPPPGTSQVYYKFQFSLGRKDNYTSMGYKFFIDGTEVTLFKRYDGFNAIYGSFNTFHVLIEIGGTNDIPNGKLSSWDTLKTLKVQVATEPGYNVWLNKSYYDIQQGSSSNNATHTATTHVRKPMLKIQAIGDAAIQNATVVAGNSMVHFQGYTASRKSFTLDSGTSKSNTFYDYSYDSNYNMVQYKNIGGCMNNSTGEFTFPHTGLYNINMTAQMSDSNNDPRTYVYWQMNKTKGTYEGSSDPNVLLCELPGYRERSTSSKIIHFQAGESFIIHSGTATQPADIYLSVTALQDQVPQAISARPGMTLETLAGVCDGRLSLIHI